MSNGHLDRLSATDASFIVQERGPAHFHIGGVMIFEGPPPPYEALLAQVDSRLHLVPRYRHKLVIPRYEMGGRPLWVHDSRFNLKYHVRHTALPPPGSNDELKRLTARVFSQRLDRSKPLWEMYLVEGLENGRFAIISKTHHALIDGVSGVDIMTLLFDMTREFSTPPPPEPWKPEPEPSQADLAAAAARDGLGTLLEVAGSAVKAVRDPLGTFGSMRDAAEGLGEVVMAGLDPAPPTPLNGPIGSHRNVTWVKNRLEDFKEVKNAFGGTLNDVVLTVVSGALAAWLRARGVRTEGLELKAGVPVSVRGTQEHNQLGNRISMLIGALPVYCDDPVERLRIVSQSMSDLKASKQALGAQTIIGLERFAPPTLFAQASRLHFSPRFANLIVTNVPGPQFPLYLLGRELLEMAPVGFLADGFRMIVAIVSYNGALTLGLMGDYDTLPDLEAIAQHLRDALADLVASARAQASSAERG